MVSSWTYFLIVTVLKLSGEQPAGLSRDRGIAGPKNTALARNDYFEMCTFRSCRNGDYNLSLAMQISGKLRKDTRMTLVDPHACVPCELIVHTPTAHRTLQSHDSQSPGPIRLASIASDSSLLLVVSALCRKEQTHSETS